MLLTLVMCLGCFAACTTPGGTEDTTADNGGSDAATLADAVEYLRSIYKDSAKETPADYDVVGKVVIGDTEFAVTWATDNADITVKVSEKNAAFYTIDIPTKNDEVKDYTLTATITDAAGQSENVSFERALPVYDASAIVAKPEAGVAYKFYMTHVSLGQTLFAIGETQDGGNKYILTTTDPKAAPDFFVEADGEGFKFYTELNGVKTYVLAKTTTSDDGKVSKYIGYSTEEGTTWIYKSETNAWYTTIGGLEYVVGTYGTYNTFCISDSSFMTPESSGTSQFPGGLMLKDVAEAMTPSAGPTIYETPEEIVNAAYELELGGVLSAGHKYTLTGVITEIPSAWSDSYGNITVVIVVNNMTDKPIECFRLKGEGANNLMVGDTITVTGELLKYDNKTETGKVEFNAGCTLVSGDFCNHTNETIPGKAATCTEAGLTDGQKCTTCGKTTLEQTTIEALGHDWNTVLAHDSANHWTACTRCTETKDKAAHNNGSDSVCDTCGYGCEHKNAPAATCGAASVCPDCGTTLANATGEHTFDNDSDATCNGCDFTREVKEMVVIFYPKDNKYMTGTEYYYSPKKMELILSDSKADAIAMEKITNADGSVSFKAGDKWLYSDGTHTEFVSAEGENTKFAIEETQDGVFIRCFTANFNGKPQYLEVYSGYLTCYGMGSDASIYTFRIESADGANGTVTDDANSPVDKNSGSSTPSTPSTGSLDAKKPEAGKAYKFAFIHGGIGSDVYYVTGAMSGFYMATSQTKAEGADFYVEATNGGYYLYCMVSGAKKYLNSESTMGTDGKMHVNGTFDDTAKTVYTYSDTLKTLVASVDGTDYIIGTRTDKTYTTLGPVKASTNPYYAQFIQ
jgi:hypothetical protein